MPVPRFVTPPFCDPAVCDLVAVFASDWKKLLAAVPAKYRQLRDPVPLARLTRIEEILGRELPAPYRSFLENSDGGWIGESRIYGSPELLHLLEERQRRFDPALCEFRQHPLAYLPFHPVSCSSFECFDLHDPGGPVCWISLDWRFAAPKTGLLDLVDPLAAEMFCERSLAGAEIQTTYTDFMDWLFDEILALDPSWH